MKPRSTKTRSLGDTPSSEASKEADRSDSEFFNETNDGTHVTPEHKRIQESWAEALDKVSFDDYEMLYDDSMPNEFDEEEWTC